MVRVYNNVVCDCSGAGIDVADWSNDGPKTHIRIANNTVYNNGSTWGGGIFVGSGQIEDVVIGNNIASDNGRWQIGAIPESLAEVSGSHNLVDGNLDEGEEYGPDCGWDECYEFAGTYRIVADPAFASTTQGSYDFHLLAGSPAVDSGTAATVDYDFDGKTEELFFDHEWTARPLDGDLDGAALFDRGAYEFDPYEDKTWTGDSGEHWNTPGNWEPVGVPGNMARVVIPDVSSASGRFPVVSAVPSQGVAILEVGPGASLSIASTMSLDVLYSLTVEGLVEISGLLNMP